MSNVNFSIAYPEITWDAIEITASEDASFPVRNLFYGGSSTIWKRSGSAISTSIVFDLGLSKASTANYCVLRGIDYIVSSVGDTYGVTIEIRASNDNFSSTDILIHKENPITLVGTKEKDAVILFDKSEFFRYWKINIATNTSVQHQLTNLFIGNLFDFDSNAPYYPYDSKYVETAKPFVSDRGSLFKSSSGKKQKQLEINWRNVSDSTRDFFQAKIIEAKDDSPICLIHNDDFHKPLTSVKKAKSFVDFNPVAAYFADASYLYDATSEGDLCEYGEGVARWESVIGSNHATQSTSELRPIRATAPVTGVRNLLDFTENLENAYYTKARLDVNISELKTPSGNNAFNLLPTGTATHFVNRQITASAGTYTIEVVAKANGYSRFAFYFAGAASRAVNVDLANCSVISTVGSQTSSVTSLGNGWCKVVLTATIPENPFMAIYIIDSGTNISFVADGTSGIMVGDLQFTALGESTPYQVRHNQYEVYEKNIVNRDYLAFDGVDDFLGLAGDSLSWLNNVSGSTIIASVKPRNAEATNSYIAYASTGSDADLTKLGLRFNANTLKVTGRRLDTDTSQDISTSANIVNGSNYIISSVVDYQEATASIANNGVVVTSASFQTQGLTTDSDSDVINIGNGSLSDQEFKGEIYALLVFDKALTSSDRQYVESLLSQKLQIASISKPEYNNINLLTAWISENETTGGENANLNNINLTLIEDVN